MIFLARIRSSNRLIEGRWDEKASLHRRGTVRSPSSFIELKGSTEADHDAEYHDPFSHDHRSPAEARAQIQHADEYFQSLGVTPSTVMRTVGNRR